MTTTLVPRLIDPHCHFWALSKGWHPWIGDHYSPLLGSLKPLNRDYLPEDYLTDAADYNIESVVPIESVATRFAGDEMLWIEKLAQDYPVIGAAMGGADLLDEDVEDLLAFYHDRPLIKGIRQILNWHQDPKYSAADRADDLNNPAWQRNFGLLARYDLMFEMQIVPQQMQAVYQLAKQYPDTIIILNHVGLPIPSEYTLWQDGIRALAQCPNVYAKLSGLGMLDPNWTADTIRETIHFVIDAMSVERCMFASNFPVDKLFCDFTTLMSRYQQVVASASADEQDQLFFSNAKRVYLST